MNWTKKKPRGQDSPQTIEKRVEEKDWPKYFSGHKENQVEVGEPFTDRLGLKLCPDCGVEMTNDGCIFCKKPEPFKKDHETGKSPADSFPADKTFLPTVKPERVQDFSYWRQIYDY